MPEVSKAELHELIEALPENEAVAAKRFLEFLLDKAGKALWVRLPNSLHAALKAWAAEEGVSLNTLVAAFLAEALGKREGKGAR